MSDPVILDQKPLPSETAATTSVPGDLIDGTDGKTRTDDLLSETVEASSPGTDQLTVDPTIETTGTTGEVGASETLPEVSKSPIIEPVYSGYMMYRKSTSTFPYATSDVQVLIKQHLPQEVFLLHR